MPDRKSLLEQLMEEAAEHGAASARESDFAVNLKASDKDGTYEIEGVPLSKVGKDFLAKFGIGADSGQAGDSDGSGDGDGKQGKNAGGGNSGATPIKDYFGGKRRAAG